MIANFVICATAVAALAACSTYNFASKQAFHAAHDSETTVVIGYFADANDVQFVGCQAESIGDLHVDCASYVDPRTSIVIAERIFGAAPSKRFTAHIREFNRGGAFPIGRAKPQLISFKTRDTDFVLVDFVSVAKTTSGEWAFAISNYDSPVLPCDARNMIFSKPIDVGRRLKKSTRDYHPLQIRYLRDDPRVEIEDETVYFKHGLTIQQLKDAIAELRKGERFDKCWKTQTGG